MLTIIGSDPDKGIHFWCQDCPWSPLMDPIRLLDWRLTVVSTAVYIFSVPMDKPYILYQKDKHWPFAGVICGVHSLHNIKSCLTVCYSPFDFYKSPEIK